MKSEGHPSAKTRSHPSSLLCPEPTLRLRTVFSGRLLRVERLVVEGPNGTAIREIVRHPGAVVVLVRRWDGKFVFVRQFRKAIESPLLEAVAGGRSPDESPPQCARRELREETGYRASRLVRLGTLYPAPGYTDEKLWVFLAEVGSPPSKSSPDRDERLETIVLSRAQFDRRVARGEIQDAKTLAAWLLFERHERHRRHAS